MRTYKGLYGRSPFISPDIWEGVPIYTFVDIVAQAAGSFQPFRHSELARLPPTDLSEAPMAKATKAMKAMKAAKAMKAMKKSRTPTDRTYVDLKLLQEPYASWIREMYNSRKRLRKVMHPEQQ
jgi:hypothetical protein